MKDSNDNGKVSDSGYTTTCVSQSQRSSGSSLSRNSNRSESSGYCDGHPSTFDSSHYALPQPISKRKDKEHKKKKSKNAAATAATATTTSASSCLGNVESTKLGSQISSREHNDLGTYDSNGSSSDITINCKKSDEVSGIDLVDDTALGERNGDSNSTVPEGGVGTNTNPLDDTTSNTNAGFCVVISMKKGLIIEATSSLKAILGYTRESWIDRSFIDFIHPKDKQTFADHLAKNITLPYGDRDKGTGGRHTSLFCSLRKHDKGRSSVGSASDVLSNSHVATQYLPFHLTTCIKFFRERTSDEKPQTMFLTVNAEPIVPVYKAPEEMIISTIFSTRHDPSCILTHVDVNVVQYFGYLPQDMIGRSLFDFYHPEDLPFLKDVYETVVKMEGSPFRSKPYRFATQNGDYVVLETEWSSFVNPWKEKLEFIVGHHRVLRGPTNPNVFEQPEVCQRILLANISEEIVKESKIIQGEIRALLHEKILRSEDCGKAHEITSRSKDLDTFVENLLQEVNPPAPLFKDRFTADDRSILEHDSVILGAISPHHEYCDSKSSTETPPSYNQLNYNEKITRFFDSKLLVATAYGSDEDNINSSPPSNEEAGKMSSNLIGTKDTTALSAENLSSGSNNRTSYDSRDDSDNPRSANTAASPKIPTLTESVLNKHNQEMEKLLVQQHKARRCTIKNSSKDNNHSRHKTFKDKSNKHNDQQKNRGTKRRSTDGREGDAHCKVSKYEENLRTCTVAPSPGTPMNVDDNSSTIAPQSKQNTTIWPSLAVPSQPTPHLCMAAQNGVQEPSKCLGFSPIVPLYYVSLPRIRDDLAQTIIPPTLSQSFQIGQAQQTTYVAYAAAPLAGVIYPPMVGTPAQDTNMYSPFVLPGPAPIHREASQSISGVTHQENPSDRKRPASQATSIKAEPGSTMAMSESSKKLFSLGEHFSSCVSIDGGCSSLVPNTKRETNTNSQFESSLEDSSDSSFYGSFLTSSNGSSCNPKNPAQNTLWKPTTFQQSSMEKKQLDSLRKGPPWQEGVKMTHELIYQYQMTPRPLEEVLRADMKALKNFKQPQMVNDQLEQLYAEGFAAKLVLCDGDGSTDSYESASSTDNNPRNIISELSEWNDMMRYSTMTMIFEENAPLPSP